MLDTEGRILIPKEFEVLNSDKREIYFYYSLEERLFFILKEKVSEHYFIGMRVICKRNRVYIPKEILEAYKTKNILLAEKENKIYILPLKEE